MTALFFAAIKTIFAQASAKLFWWSINKTFRSQLPEIFNKIDFALGAAQASRASYTLQELTLKKGIEEITHHPATPEEIRTVLSLYDPLKAAAKLLQP